VFARAVLGIRITSIKNTGLLRIGLMRSKQRSQRLSHLTVSLAKNMTFHNATPPLCFRSTGDKMKRSRNSKKFFVPLSAALLFLAAGRLAAQEASGVPVFKITPAESKVTFHVDASVAIAGTFDNWYASLVFSSPDVTSGVLNIKIDAASVDTGSG